jgi:protein O-GlcNAc transferase
VVTWVGVQDKKTKADPYEKIGDLFKSLGDLQQAKSAYDNALEADPKRVSVLVARGMMSQENDAYQLAEADFLAATAADPSNERAWSGLGVAWMYLEHACDQGECKPKGYDSYDEGSIACLRRVMQLVPDNMVTLSNLVMAENRCCDWSNRDKHLRLLRGALRDAAANKQNFAPPFHAFEFGFSPKEMLVNCKYLSQRHQESAKAGKAAVPVSAARGRSHVEKNGFRLNVGYTNGAGFHNGTTTARCLRSMFSFHDPKRINVMCYALSGDDKSEERQTIKAACSGGWTEGRAMSDVELATKVANDNVHVLVDSTGYTMKYRADFLAMSTAPIILSFHGFPGTMAAKFIHYLSSDVRTAPPEYQSFYSEKLALVPWTYLVNDHKQSRREVLTGSAPSRASLGFAEDDIILASFNQLYKIEPEVFGAWLKILSREPKTKLWLLNFSKAASKYLRKEARAAGVDPARLVFHDKFAKDTELLAKGHADLFLDTPLFNAHTTGGDVLWAGIPVVTLPGENFAQRVASGLVHSAGFSNVMIARSMGDYTRLVLALCRQTLQRRHWKAVLQAGRETAPLFDTKLLTHHVETTMKMMWEVYAAGLKPRHVVHASVRA